MRKIHLLILSLLVSIGASAANGDTLFFQNFTSATAVAYTVETARAYTSSNYSSLCGNTASSQFTTITCNSKDKTGIGINSSTGGNSEDWTGKFGAYYNNTGGYWSICKTTDFATTAPTAIKVVMKARFAIIGSGSNIGVQFAVGSGFGSGLTNSCPGLNKCAAGFALPGNSTIRIAKYATSNGNTAIDSKSSTLTTNTEYTYTWVINKTVNTLTYKGPDGNNTTVAAGCWDLWVNTTRNLAGIAKTTTGMTTDSVTLRNLYIGSPFGNKHEFVLDTLAIVDLSPSSCASAPSISVSPASASYCKDGSATALSFTGTGHTAQKWQYYDGDSWVDIDEATNATYTPSTSATGSMQYRVVTTCDNYDTYYTASDAATITVNANHSVTAATGTGDNSRGTVSAASATVCEGSTTTVTATPATGYQVTNWAVSDDDNGASISPTGTSSSTSTTLTMGTANATVTVTFGCVAPTSPSISGTTAYTAGQDISLTASATGTSASATYTWYKGEEWDDASETTPVQAASTSGATFTKASSVEGDAGTYWCEISNGTGCNAHASKTITVGPACTDPELTITLN